ncbi:putative CAAX amino terminal protease family [Candidatus Sulfotelmatomonas gaucii]|uniref:Putative CAAX amino terminal protease family n=1 Tax=Candidatus Sulfuritelmatomonas gaucii TaxID=2043161 RepID=A0A2N9L1Z9_9BACT|nr:putative CAAX amino terminal protease family [Candidatus Sulfotelmatomonas gaucii]
MEPGLQPEVKNQAGSRSPSVPDPLLQPAISGHEADKQQEAYRPDRMEWILIGPQGLRAGWSILLFAASFYFFRLIIGTIFYSTGLVDETRVDSAANVLPGTLAALLALAGTAAWISLLEGHRIRDYNLVDPRIARHLLSGLISGFAAISVLVGSLAWGGWLRFGADELSGAQSLGLAAMWGCVFLLVGLVEEGLFRCYGLFTLSRGINFWWALSAEAAICLYVLERGGNGANGVFAAAGLGLIPCLILHFRGAEGSCFWQAAWVTSTLFGVYHTRNSGENWVGILAAAAIGFVFCVSVRVTGSAWWAIGCHAAWDWAETYFYGTSDSGMAAQGHYLSTTPAGNPLWSGGSDGPEGSLLVLGVIVLLALFLVVSHGWNKLRAGDLSTDPAAG